MLHESRNKATITFFLIIIKKIISGNCILCSVSRLLYVHNNLHLNVTFQRRFATTIFSATQRGNIVATMFRMVKTQRCDAVLL